MSDPIIQSYDAQIASLSQDLGKKTAWLSYLKGEKKDLITQTIDAIKRRDDKAYNRLYDTMQDRNYQYIGTQQVYLGGSNLSEQSNDQILNAVQMWTNERDITTLGQINNTQAVVDDLTSRIASLTSQKNAYLNSLPQEIKNAYQTQAEAEKTAAAAELAKANYAGSKSKYLIVAAAIIVVVVVVVWYLRKRKKAST